jgi:hypothetical protein
VHANYRWQFRLQQVAVYGNTRMTLTSLQALTWGTVTGAVVSALLLASGESGVPDWSRLRRGTSVPVPRSNERAAPQQLPAMVPTALERRELRSEPSER